MRAALQYQPDKEQRSLAAEDGSTIIAAGLDSEIWIDEPISTFRSAHSANGAARLPTPFATDLIAEEVWGVRLMRGLATPPRQPLDAPALHLQRLLDDAALSGIAAPLDLVGDYAKTHEQCGGAIGCFQAVKHHFENMAIDSGRAGQPNEGEQ